MRNIGFTPLRIEALIHVRVDALAGEIGRADQVVASAAMHALRAQLGRAMAEPDGVGEPIVAHISGLLVAMSHPCVDHERIAALLDCCMFYVGVGNPYAGIEIGRRLVDACVAAGDLATCRRVHNMLGVLLTDASDFHHAMDHLQSAIALATELNESMLAAAALANVSSTLREMGLYRDALRTVDYVLRIADESHVGTIVRFQCAAEGLFCSSRVGDHRRAVDYMRIGTELSETPNLGIRNLIAFEASRIFYLIETNDVETAELLVESAPRRLPISGNPIANVVMSLSGALCNWASGEANRVGAARRVLRELHAHTLKAEKFLHDDVLRALVKVYGNASNPAEVQAGVAYAKELVEYTTSVKRAKFYRQMAERGVDIDPHGKPGEDGVFDPFAQVRLSVDERGPSTGSAVERNEELSAIHEDLARLRADAVRQHIRTDAYDTAENWALTAEFFDDQTGQHCFRVGRLAGMLAQEIGLDRVECVRIEHAARLHDIGKVGVNEVILMKPGPLDPTELAAMRAHTTVGAYLLEGAQDPTLQVATLVAKHHHEWWNGTGYPNGATGWAIPLVARISALADVYDALTNERPYKSAWPHEMAVREIRRLAGVQFDPDLVEPFMRVLDRYVPALAAGEVVTAEELDSNSLMHSRKRLMEVIELADQ